MISSKFSILSEGLWKILTLFLTGGVEGEVTLTFKAFWLWLFSCMVSGCFVFPLNSQLIQANILCDLRIEMTDSYNYSYIRNIQKTFHIYHIYLAFLLYAHVYQIETHIRSTQLASLQCGFLSSLNISMYEHLKLQSLHSYLWCSAR